MDLSIPQDASDASEDVPAEEDNSESFARQEKDSETAALVTADPLANLKADFKRRKADFERRKAVFERLSLTRNVSIPKDAHDASEDVPSEEDTSESFPNQEKNSETAAQVTANLHGASAAGADAADVESTQVTAKERKESRKMSRKKRQSADVVTKPAAGKKDRLLELAPGVESSEDTTPLHNASAAVAAIDQASASGLSPRPPSKENSIPSSTSSAKPGAVHVGGSESSHDEWALQTQEEPDMEQGFETGIIPIAAEVVNEAISEAQIVKTVETAKLCGQPRWLIFAWLGVLVAGAIGAGLGVPLSNGGDAVPASVRRNELKDILFAEIPTVQFGFFQTEALDWLADEDPAMIDFETTPNRTIVERFVIVTLYYSLNGPQWVDQRGFLSEESVCKWNSITTTGSSIEGVRCNEDEFVVDINVNGEGILGIAPSMSNATMLPPEIGFLNSLTLLSLGKSQKGHSESSQLIYLD
jgi:hypothetical protein